MRPHKIQILIRTLLIVFTVLLVLSGVTAFGIETQLRILTGCCADETTAVGKWINQAYQAVKDTNTKYPYLSYGMDWLAYAHLVIAVAFIGPIKDPIKNIWVIQFGIIACLGIIPMALIAGPIRSIPFFWTLIDCSFGVLGSIPLIASYVLTRKLQASGFYQARRYRA